MTTLVRLGGSTCALAARRTASDGTALTDEGLVAACENIISIQNQGWMAKWTTPE